MVTIKINNDIPTIANRPMLPVITKNLLKADNE